MPRDLGELSQAQRSGFRRPRLVATNAANLDARDADLFCDRSVGLFVLLHPSLQMALLLVHAATRIAAGHCGSRPFRVRTWEVLA